MKVRRYDELLRARGYKCVGHNDYQGTDVYEKEHSKNLIRCYIEKDSHGKAQTMSFNISQKNIPMTFEDFKTQEFDREYLWREANKIHECFELLRQMKSPKHVYF